MINLEATKHKIRSHASFGVMAIGAISIFVINFVLKHVMGPADYGKYTVLMTYLSALISFGFLGFDQIVVRLSNVVDQIVYINRKLIYYILISGLITALFAACIAYLTYIATDSFIQLFVIFLLSNFIYLVSTVNRLKSQFVLSQVCSHAWKFFLLFYVINAVVTSGKLTYLEVTFAITISMIFCGLIALVTCCRSKIRGCDDTNNNSKLLVGFILSIAIITYLNYFDRLIINNKVGLIEVGDYFYLQNFFSYPFVLISTYVGFKEMIYFKTHISMDIVRTKIIHAIKLGIALLLLITVMVTVVQLKYHNLSVTVYDAPLIIIMSITSVIRLIYSVLSSVMGAIGTSHAVLTSNIVSGVSVLVGTLIVIAYLKSIIMIAFIFAVFWTIRTITYYYQIRGFIYEYRESD
ncbi:hypothetical protein KVP06_09330 [Geobacter sulfurreducens]|uniref:Membrane protein, putative n=1 Tax=Geobacter sulfurreducens (strain ATCC 51573 / DSM 12127 / PCA) TaxID=243231 RepID=Q74C22_GEOSL|nr:hypothetical protein [Geobacter sulfurreducens]AAR35230.1 membrane protein, putative [Geobacter sulfurreducens PCA]UAC02596.1 hypothetical protein KVP06_09330 [Geobacter sulfurreducens]